MLSRGDTPDLYFKRIPLATGLKIDCMSKGWKRETSQEVVGIFQSRNESSLDVVVHGSGGGKMRFDSEYF